MRLLRRKAEPYGPGIAKSQAEELRYIHMVCKRLACSNVYDALEDVGKRKITFENIMPVVESAALFGPRGALPRVYIAASCPFLVPPPQHHPPHETSNVRYVL